MKVLADDVTQDDPDLQILSRHFLMLYLYETSSKSRGQKISMLFTRNSTQISVARTRVVKHDSNLQLTPGIRARFILYHIRI